MLTRNIGCIVLVAAALGGCRDRCAPQKAADAVERPDRTEVVLAAPGLRTIPLDSGAEIRDAPFALAWDGAGFVEDVAW